MGEEHYLEKTNKAFETAKLTSYWLYLAGIPEAIEYGKLIDLEEEVDPNLIPHSKDMCFLNPIIHEIRYHSINHYIRQSGCRNILDIACGYSPRGLLFAREGYHYIGADVPVLAKALEPVAQKAGIKGYEYIGVDATNFASLKAAADKLQGPVCIVVEGLDMYLSSQDAKAVRENIACIMSEHEGSVYVTTDPGNGYLFFDVISANYPPQNMRAVFGMLFEMYNWASDGGITMQTDQRPIETDVASFREAGLLAKPSPLLPGSPALRCYSKLSGEAAERIAKSLEHPFTFVSTLSPEYGKSHQAMDGGMANGEEFHLQSQIKGDTLLVTIAGRLDTLSSPELLACFEEAKDNVEAVEIDCRDVTYLAASGNRVLHLIRKQLADENKLRILNLRESVAVQIKDDEIIKHMGGD